ncbi:MAG: 1-deoxy-D-xylulose-5-phosphate synthase [Clostridiales bacterium]|jgi:1-deoxy-D-xylulose-5-phosphate synthase|nr:1-deoxy-D-xylulose-5-phosphate synthase [Clostridiales bacterium]
MTYLEKINSPNDIKNLSFKSLTNLSQEIREFIIESVSGTGGHLASNLGVVEITLAMHYVFDSPIDKFIFDVGHQCYTHKILTGRKNKFNTLRKKNGLSGFPKSSESKHDCFDTGHSSTSISAALGFCVARDLEKKKYNIIALIGDGALTGGLAYEGLNNAGKLNTNLIIILNDNEMSISKNTGAIAKHLNDLRTMDFYLKTKRDIKFFLNKFPGGKNLSEAIAKLKSSFKNFVYPNIIFEQLGFYYIGPVDGHDIKKLINILNNAKKILGPILIHVKTIKGKGYKPAQEYPIKFHGTTSFNKITGHLDIDLNKKKIKTYSDFFGDILIKLSKKNKKIIAITAAMRDGTGLTKFSELYPERFFDVGIAESHAVTFAAGLAKNNLIPVVAIYSSFLQRSYDQILHDVCLQNLHVVFMIDRVGLSNGDGETHHGIYDISFLSHMPNITIMSPKNKFEFEDMINFAIDDFSSPIAIRYPRGKISCILKSHRKKIEHGDFEIIYDGDDLSIVSFGSTIKKAVRIYNFLKKEKKIEASLINARFAKPINLNLINYIKKYKKILLLEDNNGLGGFAQNLISKAIENNIYLRNIKTVL